MTTTSNLKLDHSRYRIFGNCFNRDPPHTAEDPLRFKHATPPNQTKPPKTLRNSTSKPSKAPKDNLNTNTKQQFQGSSYCNTNRIQKSVISTPANQNPKQTFNRSRVRPIPTKSTQKTANMYNINVNWSSDLNKN